MKQFLLLFTLLYMYLMQVHGQADNKHFSYSTCIGTGIAMSEPSCTPFIWQIKAHYHLNQRFAIGAGSGVSIYEKALIPLYTSIQFFLSKPRLLVPYLECEIGGAFAPDKEANGGFYLSPSLGLTYRIASKVKMNLSLGYELQKLERLKRHTDKHFYTEFKEELSHHSLAIKLGLTY